ncbi:MAG: hypothetical protein U5K51_06655 [Flavobacteriaceae bacterium]|nr:hypothetical protein [Flavobacteriaceae bacterium]
MLVELIQLIPIILQDINGFSINMYFPVVDTRFFKFKRVKKEFIDLKEEAKYKRYPYGEFPKIWYLYMTESKN